MAHNPTPYSYRKSGAPYDQHFQVNYGNDGECVAEIVAKEANAAFIVEACNAHKDLVERLDCAEFLLRDLLALIPSSDKYGFRAKIEGHFNEWKPRITDTVKLALKQVGAK